MAMARPLVEKKQCRVHCFGKTCPSLRPCFVGQYGGFQNSFTYQTIDPYVHEGFGRTRIMLLFFLGLGISLTSTKMLTVQDEIVMLSCRDLVCETKFREGGTSFW